MENFIVPEIPSGLKGNAKKKWNGEWSLRKLAYELGYTVVGEYVGANTPIHMICPEGHDCYPTPASFRKGARCRVCAGNCPIQAEKDFRELAASEGWIIVGEYVGALKPIHMICPEGHDCYPTPKDFKSDVRCRVCSGRCPIQAEKDFRELAASEGWIIVGEYTGSNPPIHMICPEGHDCHTRPADFKNGKRCRVCAKYGFNPELCGLIYIYLWTHPTTKHQFIKYGITNATTDHHKGRIRTQARKTEYEPTELGCWFYLQDGQKALDDESAIKAAVGTRYISKEIFPDGWTETCSYTHENIGAIESIVGIKLGCKID